MDERKPRLHHDLPTSQEQITFSADAVPGDVTRCRQWDIDVPLRFRRDHEMRRPVGPVPSLLDWGRWGGVFVTAKAILRLPLTKLPPDRWRTLGEWLHG